MTTDEAIQKQMGRRIQTDTLPFYTLNAMTRVELASLFAAVGFTSGVEVGTYRGSFANLLCRVNRKLHLTCVDPWMPYDGRTQEREEYYYDMAMRRLSKRNVTIVRKTSLEAVRDVADQSLDFVFIDGNHAFDYAMMDIILWTPKVREEGIVAVHDYDARNGVDVMSAVNAYVHAHKIYPWYITTELMPTAYWVQR
jgi:predicted O-methyltransferase YrrM